MRYKEKKPSYPVFPVFPENPGSDKDRNLTECGTKRRNLFFRVIRIIRDSDKMRTGKPSPYERVRRNERGWG